MLNHVEFETSKEVADRHNVEAAWLRLKQRFPLLGAYVEEEAAPDGSGDHRVEFVLDEWRLGTLRPGELRFRVVDTLHDVEQLIDKIQHGELTLSNDLIGQIWFVQQNDTPGRYHLVTNLYHIISDGSGAATITREFMQELASLSTAMPINLPLLSKRIESLLPVEVLHPSVRLPLPQRRWRLAIARVISDLRQAKMSVRPLTK